jgi:hypothetical protein
MRITSSALAFIPLPHAKPSPGIGGAVKMDTWPWCEHTARRDVTESPAETTAVSAGSAAGTAAAKSRATGATPTSALTRRSVGRPLSVERATVTITCNATC